MHLSATCFRYKSAVLLPPGHIRLDNLQPVHLAVLALRFHHANPSDPRTKVAENRLVRLLRESLDRTCASERGGQ